MHKTHIRVASPITTAKKLLDIQFYMHSRKDWKKQTKKRTAIERKSYRHDVDEVARSWLA